MSDTRYVAHDNADLKRDVADLIDPINELYAKQADEVQRPQVGSNATRDRVQFSGMLRGGLPRGGCRCAAGGRGGPLPIFTRVVCV